VIQEQGVSIIVGSTLVAKIEEFAEQVTYCDLEFDRQSGKGSKGRGNRERKSRNRKIHCGAENGDLESNLC
jgi:hypothetical protein